jgi:hypothetical protein
MDSQTATRLVAGACAFALAAALTVPASADPVIGFTESFLGVDNVAGWLSQASNTNPGTGGVGGLGDGYLEVGLTGFAGRLGSHNMDAAYTGDWLAAGADRIRLSLKDVGANQNLEIHVAIGNSNSFWQSNVGFIPPEGEWNEFTVDLNDSANFTRIIAFGSGGYSLALSTVDRVLVRHDTAPFSQLPDAILAEFGIDEFKIQSTTVGVEGPVAVGGRAVALAPPVPNPARGSAKFAFESFDDAPVTIAIVDARGRTVRRAVVAGVAGRRSWLWDGRDESGRETAAGVYRVRAFGPAGGTSRALVRLD